MSGMSGSSVDPVARSKITFVLNVYGTDALQNQSAALPSGFITLSHLLCFTFLSNDANTGPMTLDIGDGIPREMSRKDGYAFEAGDIPSGGSLIEAFYDKFNNKFLCQVSDLATSLPLENGVSDVGVSTRLAREDHVHPYQSFLDVAAGDDMSIATRSATKNISAATEFLNYRIHTGGSYRVSGTVINDYYQVYKNGVGYSANHYFGSYSDDVTVVAGDTIQIFASPYAGTVDVTVSGVNLTTDAVGEWGKFIPPTVIDNGVR